MASKISPLRSFLKEVRKKLKELGWMKVSAFSTGTIAVLVSTLSLVKQTLADPPHPRALLVCTTDGLPDLEVICSTHLSSGYHTGYLDFDDGSDPTEIETGILPPVPLRFVEQVWKDIIVWPWNKVKNCSKSAWNYIQKKKDPPGKDDSDNNMMDSVQMVYRHRYKRGGEYNISLFLEGDDDADSTVKIVRLQESSSLVKGSLGINHLTLKFKNNDPTRPLEYRIMDVLRTERIFLPTFATKKIQIHPTVGEDWKLTDDACKFTRSLGPQHDVDGDGPSVKVDGKEVSSEYFLYANGWAFGRPYVRFDEVIRCSLKLNGSRKMEATLKILPDKISRYGVFGLEEDEEGNDEGILVYNGTDSVGKWTLEHKHEENGSSKVYKPNSGHDTGPIEIRCHGVRLSLVDPPLGHQPEGWHSRVWVEVTPLN